MQGNVKKNKDYAYEDNKRDAFYENIIHKSGPFSP